MKSKTIYSVIIKSQGVGRYWLREVCMSVDTCRGSISRFSYETGEHRQVLEDTGSLCIGN